MAVSFCGVMAISFSKPTSNSDTADTYLRVLGIILAFVTSWFFAGCYAINRKLKEINVSVILFFTGLMGLVTATTLLLTESIMNGSEIRTFSMGTYGMLLLICCLDFV
jgi:drug/metabolite transporter (DMT)-like permease